jgi:hypothetical protein
MATNAVAALDVEQARISFQAAYSAQRYDEAVSIFENALAVDPEGTVRHFVSYVSGQLAETLVETKNVESVAATLDKLLSDHPSIHLICPNEKATVDRLLTAREKNIQRGLPSAVLISMGKSASVAVANIFNSGFHLPSFAYSLINLKVIDSWARDYARGGACYVTHLDPSRETVARLKAAGLNKIIVHVRDPRQALVSLVHHFDMYPEQIVKHRDDADAGRSVSERAMSVLPFYANSIHWITNWLELEGEIDILFSTFEDFVTDRTAFVESYLKFYEGSRAYFSWQDAFGEHAGVDSHFRSGRTDEWREVFSEKDAEYLSSLLSQRLKGRFGWSDPGDPTQDDRRRLLSVAWPSPRDRFLVWLYDGDARTDAAGLDKVRRLRAAGDHNPSPELEEQAVRARLRELPDHGTLLMRLCQLIEFRGEILPDGLAIHALRSRLAELSEPVEGSDPNDLEVQRAAIRKELAVQEAKEGPRAYATQTEPAGVSVPEQTES